MNLELRNVGFINKGSELMLHAIVQRVSKEFPDTNFVMAADDHTAPYIKRARLGFYQKPWYIRKGVPFHEIFRVIPASIRKSFGLVIDSELDVVLDASGFSYSDQWGKCGTLYLAKAIKRWKRHKTKVILLPQAFGPFTSKDLITAMNIVADQSDLIYARDSSSFEHLVRTVGRRPNIKMAPDFTTILPGIVPYDFNDKKNKFCIIPNYRMIDKTSQEISAAYIPFLITVFKYLLEKQQKPFFLIHEGEDDFKLAQKVVSSLNEEIEIVKESDPLKIKGIIGTCKGTLGSRFHGVVSSLSQGIPTLGTGWSHKYKMLFDSYDCGECLLSSISDNEEIFKKIDLIVDEPSKGNIHEKIVRCSIQQKQMTEVMWNEVFQVIKK